MSTYAIGDIHGCLRTLQALLDTVRPAAGDKFVFLGDYIDRGPDSKGVIDRITALRRQGFEVVCLRGNHEQMLIEALANRQALEFWLHNGGEETLASFGAESLDKVPETYLDFFQNTEYWHETNGFLCVHGGIDGAQPDPLSDPKRLMWARQWYGSIDYNWLGGRIILHGHTPMYKSEILEQHADLERQRYLNLDNGCVYALRRYGLGEIGRLTAFCLETRELIWQDCVDKA